MTMSKPLLWLAALLLSGLATAQTATPSKPPAEKPATTATVPAAPVGRVVLRLGSFNNQNLAERHLAELAMLGVQAQIDNIIVQEAPIYRVRSAVMERSEALRIQELLRANGVSSYMTLTE